MSKLDREYQRKILIGLRSTYPDPADAAAIQLDDTDERWTFNCVYLHQHGLIDANVSEYLSQPSHVHAAAITAAGLDFLEDDGGLSAILGVVTVRLEAESMRALLATRIDNSPLPAEEKGKFKAALQKVGNDALGKIAERLMDAALDHAPDALRIVQSMLG